MHALRWTERKLGIAAIDVELLSPLPLNECVSRLQAAISPFSALFIAGPVLGDITGTRLRAQKQIGWRVLAHLEADLIEDGERTRFKCRFRMQYYGFRLPLIPAFYNFALDLFNQRGFKSLLISVFLLLIGLGVGCTGLYFANQDRRFLLNFLEVIVGAQPTRGTLLRNGDCASGERTDAATTPP